jgi:hypothetical protein
MYRAFNLLPFQPNDALLNKGLELFNETSLQVRESLEAFLEGGKLDATSLMGHWFPNMQADVFISHSHADKRLVLIFAAWLSATFGIKSFIDSSVWGNADHLLKQIDDVHCLNPDGATYSYERRNKSTGHVHMMLATALAKVIDKIECVVFVNTPNAITPEQSVNKTRSPWIFYKLAMVGLIRRRPTEEHRPLIKEAQFSTKGALDEILIQYDADLTALSELDEGDLNNWQQQWKSKIVKPRYPLDLLYDLVAE